MTSIELFHARLRGEGEGHSDIRDHLCTLRLLAERCDHITEFGVRTGNSTTAFLAGLWSLGQLVSYDINDPQFKPAGDMAERWTFHRAATNELSDIAPTDLLFIDTLHTYGQVKAELKHGNRARKYLVFHDTTLNGEVGEDRGQGIWNAIEEFMAANPHWIEFAHCRHNNGLLILHRMP